MIMDQSANCVEMIFIPVVLVVQWLSTGTTAPTSLLVTRVGPCSSALNKTMVTISEMSVVSRSYDPSVSGWLNISADIKNGWDVKVTMQKCQDMRNLDTCDYLKSYLLVRGGCQSDDDDSQSELYTFFFRHTKPRMSCPIKAGSYRIQSFPFPIEDNYVSVSESKISTSVFGYTYTIEGILERNKVTCLVAHMQLIYIHPHGVAADGDRAAGNSLENEY